MLSQKYIFPIIPDSSTRESGTVTCSEKMPFSRLWDVHPMSNRGASGRFKRPSVPWSAPSQRAATLIRRPAVLQVTAKGNPRDVMHMMEDLLKEGIVEVDPNLGAVVILKELSENSLKIKVKYKRPSIREVYTKMAGSLSTRR